jgi:hypothetical protein
LTHDDAGEVDEGLTGLPDLVGDQRGRDSLAGEEVEDTEELPVVDDDVEQALDDALAARVSGSHANEFEEEEEEEEDDGLGPEGPADDVPLRRPDEFLCRACFLIKRASQLADRTAQLCRDCA